MISCKAVNKNDDYEIKAHMQRKYHHQQNKFTVADIKSEKERQTRFDKMIKLLNPAEEAGGEIN